MKCCPAREPKDDSMSLSVTRDILTEMDNMSIPCVILAKAGIQVACLAIFLFGTLLDEMLIIQKLGAAFAYYRPKRKIASHIKINQ